jgi:ABC-2 type transport system ATP-binding protein
MKQKVVLAAALIHRPRVLILDEPLDGLDANTARVVKELLRTLAAQGCAVLFCSHILEVVERVCTRIVVINKGQQIAAGTPAEIAASTGTATLDDAFAKLTGVRDAGQITGDILRALEPTTDREGTAPRP